MTANIASDQQRRCSTLNSPSVFLSVQIRRTPALPYISNLAAIPTPHFCYDREALTASRPPGLHTAMSAPSMQRGLDSGGTKPALTQQTSLACSTKQTRNHTPGRTQPCLKTKNPGALQRQIYPNVTGNWRSDSSNTHMWFRVHRRLQHSLLTFRFQPSGIHHRLGSVLRSSKAPSHTTCTKARTS